MKKEKIKKTIKMILLIFVCLLAAVFVYFFIGFPKTDKNISWGVNFSQEKAERFGLDWKQLFSAIVEDLKVKNIKIAVSWDYIEGKENNYYFNDLDWQMKEAEKGGAKVILAIGRKTPGWPECHLPVWAKNKGKEEQQTAIMDLLKTIVERYKNSPNLIYWQVENEPFFPFGECSWKDDKFLKKEIEFVKSLDPSRLVMITESGEFSLWAKASQYGDLVGVTMYRKAWFRELNSYIDYPFPSVFYGRKAALANLLFGKKIICTEFQAEPWGPEWNYTLPLDEQLKSFNINSLKKNINYAEKTGLSDFYFWGTEWWYWMKEKNNRPEFWEEIKNLIVEK
jgi:hypothetical protein